MDSPTVPSGHSEPGPRAGEPAAMAAPDTFRDSVRVPERLRAPPVSVAPLAAPVAPPGPAPGVDYDSLITEDDELLDMLAEKQQRLLTGSLYDSWAGPGAGRSFLAAANVGVFPEPRNPAIVPDVFLSLDVQLNANRSHKEHRAYFVWVFGKAPDLVVEIIVSNRKGREIEEKRLSYARMGVRYCVVYDPFHEMMRDDLRIYRLSGGSHVRQAAARFPDLGLGMMLWEGEFEGVSRAWLRWTDAHGVLILTGQESAEQAHRQAEKQQAAARERRRAEQEQQRADQAQGRAERLEALLRRAGIDPEHE